MKHALLLATALLCAGCTLPPPQANMTRDFDIAVGGPDANGHPIIAVTNNSAPMAWLFDWANFGKDPSPWIPLPSGDSYPRTCNFDGFVTYNPTRKQFYRSIVQGFIDSATDTRGGWCVGTSDSTGLKWTWQHIDQSAPVDGARISYTHDAIVIASGAEDPVYWIPFDGSAVRTYTVNLVQRRVIRTIDDGPTALVAGIDLATQTVKIARLWPSGQIDMSAPVAPVPQDLFVERVRDDPDTTHAFQLDDAWLDRVHNVVWLAVTTGCPYTTNPAHSCATFLAVNNYDANHTFDDPSVWTLTGGLFLSQLDDKNNPFFQQSDTWLPRVTTDDQGNAMFTATISGPSLYPTAIGGMVSLAVPYSTGTAIAFGQLNILGQSRLPILNGAVHNSQDFNGIAPDATRREFVWTFSASTQPLSHDVFGNDEVFFYGNIVQFGRTCDPNTRRCS